MQHSATFQIYLGRNRPSKNWVLSACSGRTAVSLLMNPWKHGLLSQSWSRSLLVRSLCCIAAVLLLGGIVHCSRGGASNILCKDGGTERTLLQWSRLILLCCTVIIPEAHCCHGVPNQWGSWSKNSKQISEQATSVAVRYDLCCLLKSQKKTPQWMSSKSKRC